jgi:hypothetical protein
VYLWTKKRAVFHWLHILNANFVTDEDSQSECLFASHKGLFFMRIIKAVMTLLAGFIIVRFRDFFFVANAFRTVASNVVLWQFPGLVNTDHFFQYSVQILWDEKRSWLRHCTTRREVLVSISLPVLLSAFSSPGVHSASNRNEYQGTSMRVKCGRHGELKALLS